MFEAHLAPVGVDFFGDDGGEACRYALAELEVVQEDGNGVVGSDASERPSGVCVAAAPAEAERGSGEQPDRETGRAKPDDLQEQAPGSGERGRRKSVCVGSHGHYPMISEARATAPRIRV